MKPGRRLTLAALAIVPFALRAADELARKRLALLSRADEAGAREQFAGPLKALAARGYIEGRNLEVILSYHYRKDGLDDRVLGIVAWKPDAILTEGTVTTERLLRVTRTIPIVTSVSDPVGAGFAKTLARPGGNVTGLSQGGPEMATKTMEVLRILLPRIARIAIVFFDDALGRLLAAFPAQAAKAADLVPVPFAIREREDMPRLFRSIAGGGCQAAYSAFMPDNDESEAVQEAIRNRIALVSASEFLTETGALASLAADGQHFAERSAEMLVKIFRGAKAGEIPFEYPRQFRFVLNAATAARIGVKVTPDIRLRADRVIE